MGKRHAPKTKVAERGSDWKIDGMIRMEELGRKEVQLSDWMKRPAYAGTKLEQKTIYHEQVCKSCGYYYKTADMPKEDCMFPWFEPQDHDIAAYDYLPCKEGLTYEEE